MSDSATTLTDRQLREIDYHRGHARRFEARGEPVGYDLITSRRRRWWNASWAMYTHLLAADLRGRKALVAGCGFGEDALRLARLGAEVHAFDLSPDVLAVARRRTAEAKVDIVFSEQPIERLDYGDGIFDCILARDILHHVDIPLAMAELTRVAASGAMFVGNEVYCHSLLERIRRSRLVSRGLYPRMVDYIYEGAAPYITDDERKLSEVDVRRIVAPLAAHRRQYFGFVVSRLVPPRYTRMAKLDRLALKMLGPVGGVLAGRVLVTGRMR